MFFGCYRRTLGWSLVGWRRVTFGNHKWTEKLLGLWWSLFRLWVFKKEGRVCGKLDFLNPARIFPLEKRYIVVFFSESHRFGLYHLMRGENHSVMRAPPFKKVCFPTKCRVFSLLLYLCRFLRKKPATSHSHLKGILGGKWCVVLFNSRLGDS